MIKKKVNLNLNIDLSTSLDEKKPNQNKISGESNTLSYSSIEM